MKLYIKQKVFAITPNFSVKNAYGEDVYQVVGEFFTLKSKLSVFDTQGREVARISKEIFTILPLFTIELSDGSTTQLKRGLSPFIPKYTINHHDWMLQGDFLAHEYQVTTGTRPIMNLSKHWFTWGDSYELDIQSENDALLALCIALAIDIDLASQSNN